MPHLSIASTWAGETLSFTSGSRPSWRRCFRFRNSFPAACAPSDGLKRTASQRCSGGSYGAPKIRFATWVIDAMPSPPRGPVRTRISLRTRSGACSAISCATMPPIREAEHIRLVQTKCSAEGDRVGAHLLERGGDLAGAAGNPGVVEQDHLMVASQAIRHRRVPIIHGAQVVHVEDERHASGLAEAAIGEADSVGFNKLRRNCYSSKGTHCVILFLCDR